MRLASGQVLQEINFHRVDVWTRYDIPFNSGSATSVQIFAGMWANGDTWVQADEFSLRRAS